MLNTFAYTGSLSVACGLGGAAHVTTLDLSKPTVQWAEDNWASTRSKRARAFHRGRRFRVASPAQTRRAGFDCVILDPPSFSRGHKGIRSPRPRISQASRVSIEILVQDGILVTSINSANISWAKYESEVALAARAKKFELRVLGRIDQPETFPTLIGDSDARYLKGWMFRALKR